VIDTFIVRIEHEGAVTEGESWTPEEVWDAISSYAQREGYGLERLTVNRANLEKKLAERIDADEGGKQ
jgi:hypothetical protein